MKYVFYKNWGVWPISALVALAAVFLATGCSDYERPNRGPYWVRIPVNDDKGQYHLRTVELTSVTDLSAMSGSTVNIHVGAKIATESDENGVRLKFTDLGSTPTAHFLKEGDVYIPSDYDTLMMATAVYQFEKIRGFYDKYQANEGLVFPRSLLLDVNETATNGTQTVTSLNNAQYITPFDIFVLNPYRGRLLPSPTNGGLLSHEYFHSIFQQNIDASLVTHFEKGHITESAYLDAKNSLSEFKPEIEEISQDEKTVPGVKINVNVMPQEIMTCANDYDMAAFNEGLADFMGYAYTHDPRFGMASYPPSMSRVRNLDFAKGSPFSLYGSEENFIAWSIAVAKRNPCRTDPHILGATIARYLYLVSLEWGLDETVREALDFSKRYTDFYVLNRSKMFMGVGQILPKFFENKKPDKDLCDKLSPIFPAKQVPLTACDQLSSK